MSNTLHPPKNKRKKGREEVQDRAERGKKRVKEYGRKIKLLFSELK